MKNLSKILELVTKTLKVLMINTIVFSLIQIPFVSETFAATSKKSNGGFEAQDIVNLASGALGVYSNYLGQKQQMLQQQITSANNQKLIAQLSPTCRKADGTACYTTPAKLFPECTLPASMSNMPANACNNPTPEVNQISSMITYESISQGWMNYYDQMSNEASNSSYAVGLRCLGDKQKAMDSQLTEMVNSLQRLQDRLNQDKQIFRDNNKKLLEDMNTANDELLGSSGGLSKNNLNIKTQDFAKYFSQSCLSVIGKDAIKSGSANGGLSGILQGLSSTNKAASDFNLNKNVIEDDVRREASKIATSINGSGIDDFLSNSSTQSNIKSTSYPTIETTVKKQAAELNTARARINKELSALGYTPPAMDKNFTVDMNDFMAGSADFFKKKYVNDCVTGASSGIAIPVSDILNSLEQKSTNSEGTARNDYRAALKKILDSDAMMDEKMVSIKDLQSQYPDITITYKDSTQSRITESPYNLFMKTIDKCQQRFTQDDQFSSKGSSGVSYQKKVERGRAALQELKNLNDSFSSKITQAITDQVLNCNGQASKAGSDCSEESLKSTSDNFCVAHASSCANDIQGCYAEANNQVQTRKTKMANLAKTYNANVSAMITRSNTLYEQQKAAVTNITQMIQSKFPGTNFEIPKDMFVAMPELSKDTYGVEMAGNGDTKSFLEGENSMPGKIDKLKLVFQKQRDAVKKATDDYIGLQKTAMEKERGRWEKLAGDCKSAIDKSSSELAKANNEGLKKQGEEDQKVAKFCKKYNSISQNPLGACGKAKDLSDIADQVSARLSNQSLALSEQYASACDGLNNQNDDLPPQCDGEQKGATKAYCDSKMKAASKKSGADAGSSSSGPKVKRLTFTSLCGSGSSLKSDSDFIAAASKKLASDDQATIKEISSFDGVVKKSEDINDSNFFSNISSMISSETSGSVCEKLKSVAKADEDLDPASIEKSSAAKEKDFVSTQKSAELKLANKDILPEERARQQGIYDSAASDIKRLSTEKDSKLAFAENNKKLKSYFNDLASVTATPDPTASSTKLTEIKNIGEQMTGPCDMQSNSNITKNTGFDLSGFDAGVLGANSRSK
ncbi:MAG: hypothetical protein H7281_05200 [Bacteriovorax sp.]|nr:hypothetical protein [Bacteriovorax sp.]